MILRFMGPARDIHARILRSAARIVNLWLNEMEKL